MAELVYAYDSKSYESNLMWVRVPPAALMVKHLKIIKEAERETRKTMTALILGGFGLVAALAWNDAIQSFFNAFFPKTSGLVGKFIYAAIITIIVVIVSSQLRRISEREE